MRRLLHSPWLVLVAVLVVAVAAGLVPARIREAWPHPAGAEFLVDGDGPRPPHSLNHSADPPTRLDDMSLYDMRLLSAGADGFTLIADREYAAVFIRVAASGEIVRAGSWVVDHHRGTLDMAADGTYAVTWGVTVWEATPDWHSEPAQVEAPLLVGAVDVDTDGRLLVGSASGPTIDSLTLDGDTRRLLAPGGGFGAGAAADDSLGPIVALHRLPDQRVVFVSDTADGFRLYVLESDQVRPIGGEGAGNPVRFTGGAPIRPDEDDPMLPNHPRLPAMTPVAAGPGSRVITIGLGRGSVPEISLVDVDSGEVDLLARLDGVVPSELEPVSAVAVGDDLVFTAGGCLWRLEGAFADLT